MTTGPDAGPTTQSEPAGQPATMTTNTRRITRQLSLPLTILVAALFAAGVISGWYTYLDRSPVRHKYIPGASAWWQHLIVAVLACAAFGYARWRHQRRPGRHGGRLWLLAPLGKPAARRAARTVLSVVRLQPGFGRALLALPPAGLFLYNFWRTGLQVTAGLDANFTVNAWGGPTYLGAMACHYLDALLLIAAAAWLLNWILLPDPASTAANSAAPGQASDGTLPRAAHTKESGHVRTHS